MVGLYGVVEITARYRNSIFRSFDLGLKVAKVIIRFQLGIVLAHRQQATQSAAERVLRLLILSKLLRIGWGLRRIDCDFGGICPRVDDVGQGRFLEVGRSFDGWPRVGIQIRSS